MSMVRVRPAREADIPAVQGVVADAFAPFTARTGIVPAPMSLDWLTVVSALAVSVAVPDDRVLGVLVAWPHPDHLLVDTLAVAQEAQGAGVGAALLAHADALAAGRPLRLYTNAGMTEALGWYRRRGFTETGRRTENGYERVYFAR